MTEWYDFPNVKSTKMLSFLFGSRGLRSDLPSPSGRKFLFASYFFCLSIATDAPSHSSINHTKYKFDQTDREVFESTLTAALGSADFSELTSTGNLDKYADFIVSTVSTAIDKAIPKSKGVRSESNPSSDETIALIKEKHRLRRQYSHN